MSFFMLGAPELDAGLQVGSHESRVKGQNHLPQPAAHASLDAAQDTVGLLGCKHTLPAHVEFLISISCSSASNRITKHLRTSGKNSLTDLKKKKKEKA